MPDDNFGQILPFRPATTDAEAILDQYIAEAQASPFITNLGIDWDVNTWDISKVANAERATTHARFTFPDLSPKFLDFMKAYVIHEVASNFPKKYQIGKYATPVKNARYVQEAMDKFGITSPVDLNPQILNYAMSLFTGSENTKEQNRSKVGWFVKVLLQYNMYNQPYKWSPPLKKVSKSSKQAKNRIRTDSLHKILSTEELDAIIQLFNQASTPYEKIVAGMLGLLCCAPMRIEELLLVPRNVDCLLDPGDNLQSGLTWRPKKGGLPGLKYVPAGMVDVAKRSLQMIKQATQDAHEATVQLLAENPDKAPRQMSAFKHYPFIDPEHNVQIDEALFVYFDDALVRPIAYIWFTCRISDLQGGKYNLFRKLGILLPDGSVPDISTHQLRHYHNTIACKCNMSEFDRARWSGRKNMAQNAVYDQETPDELSARIRAKLHGKKPTRAPQIFNEKEFDLTTIREAMHSTAAGWCSRSLRQDPCTMFGTCLNCQHLVCVKGAQGKLDFIRRDLERTQHLLQLAQEKKAGGLKLQDRWIVQYETKIARLTQLVEILSDDSVEDGSLIMLADDPTLIDHNPVAEFLSSKGRKSLTVVDEDDLLDSVAYEPEVDDD